VDLNGIDPADVRVELCLGRVDAAGDLTGAYAIAMEPVGPEEEGHGFRAAAVSYRHSGRHGFTLRVLPSHPDLPTPFLPGLITWA
jgi:starch phosphorylase